MCDFEEAVVSTRVAVLNPVLLSVFFSRYLLSPGLCALPLPSLGMTCTNLRVVFKVQFEHFLCVVFPGHWPQVSPFRWECFRGRDRESPVGRTSPRVSFVPTSPSIARVAHRRSSKTNGGVKDAAESHLLVAGSIFYLRAYARGLCEVLQGRASGTCPVSSQILR